MECLRTECANRSANAVANIKIKLFSINIQFFNIKIQFFNIKIQFIDITKHGTNNKIWNLECKIQTLILAVITLHIYYAGESYAKQQLVPSLLPTYYKVVELNRLVIQVVPTTCYRPAIQQIVNKL
jgi:hypothetical protein